jgi:Flp pilus assembly protein TadG
MKRLAARLFTDRHGASAVEFALAAPVLLIMIIGMAQMGILFQANAGLQHALGEAARYATINPTPSDTAIIAKANAKRFGLVSSGITGPSISHGTNSGAAYVDLTMSYSVPLDFIVFTGPSVTLSATRRAYTN